MIIGKREKNKMGLYNISTVFGATLIRAPKSMASEQSDFNAISNVKYQANLVASLICFRNSIFVKNSTKASDYSEPRKEDHRGKVRSSTGCGLVRPQLQDLLPKPISGQNANGETILPTQNPPILGDEKIIKKSRESRKTVSLGANVLASALLEQSNAESPQCSPKSSARRKMTSTELTCSTLHEEKSSKDNHPPENSNLKEEFQVKKAGPPRNTRRTITISESSLREVLASPSTSSPISTSNSSPAPILSSNPPSKGKSPPNLPPPLPLPPNVVSSIASDLSPTRSSSMQSLSSLAKARSATFVTTSLAPTKTIPMDHSPLKRQVSTPSSIRKSLSFEDDDSLSEQLQNETQLLNKELSKSTNSKPFQKKYAEDLYGTPESPINSSPSSSPSQPPVAASPSSRSRFHKRGKSTTESITISSELLCEKDKISIGADIPKSAPRKSSQLSDTVTIDGSDSNTNTTTLNSNDAAPLSAQVDTRPPPSAETHFVRSHRKTLSLSGSQHCKLESEASRLDVNSVASIEQLRELQLQLQVPAKFPFLQKITRNSSLSSLKRSNQSEATVKTSQVVDTPDH
eukprot:TRINITY_DN7525_c0_g1_i1.p1 TRINITY_DN7525_c0_g1~~TRINITY_DN7525_c0_g1_i1.p1  ORF type:complete len:575 (+),score=143.32 TRINITY_DN7525_c0_g1_i1:784-2508(+)